MKTDLLLLTLLYAVAASASIGAINARGPARVVLSWFLAILTLCAAVFHTSQMLAGQAGREEVVVAPPLEPAPTSEPIAPQPDTAALSASRREAAVAEGRNTLRPVLDAGRRVVRSLSTLNLAGVAEISDEEYEVLQNRAIGYLTEARRVKDKLSEASSKVPPELRDAQDALSKGVDALVSAAYNAERFFKAENDTEERQHAAAFRRGTQEAASAFRRAGEMLGSTEE